MMTRLGLTDPQARADRVFELEMKIAQRPYRRAGRAGRPSRAVTSWTHADFARRAPGIDWDGLLDRRPVAGRQQNFIALASAAHRRASPPWSPASRCRPGRTGWRSTPRAASPAVLPT